MTPKPLLLCLLLASDYLEGAVALYRTDPIDLHRALRERYVSGVDVSSEVSAIIRATGDYSFDTLLEPSPTVRRALRLQSRAWEAWSGNDPDRAVQLYQDAARVLKNIRAPSERAFCYYYISEIFSE